MDLRKKSVIELAEIYPRRFLSLATTGGMTDG